MSIEAPRPTMSVEDLKRVKNSVIGNPVAKTTLSRDPLFMRSLVECIDVASVGGTVGNEIKVEAVHIVASLSYGSESALETLLRLQTPRILIFALSQFTPTDPLPLRSAYARALRAIVASVAEIVGPSEYGLRPETTGPMQIETKEALGLIFARLARSVITNHTTTNHTNNLTNHTPDNQIETLDILLPLLLSPSPQLATPIVQLLASATRSLHHRTTLASYLPPSERLAANAAKSKKRGWEKIASPTSPSAALPATSPIIGRSTSGGGGGGAGGAGGGNGGGWVVRVLVGLLARSKDVKLQEAALLALVALAKENAGVAVPLARGMVYQPDLFGPPLALIHTLMRSRNVDVQLAACLCATHILRATHASSHAASTTHVFDYAQTTYAQVPLDDACVRAVLNMVNRVVVEGGGEAVERRVRGCYILYHLTTDDRALCQFAYDRMCLDTLAGVVKTITPVEPKEGWDESESEGVVRLREASLTAIATLGLFNEQIRRAITDVHGLLPYIMTALRQGIPPDELTSTDDSLSASSSSSKVTRARRLSGGSGTATPIASSSSRPLSDIPDIPKSASTSFGERKGAATNAAGVRYAGCQCVRVLARGVSVLRTTIVDSGLGMEVFGIVMRGARVLEEGGGAKRRRGVGGGDRVDGGDGDEEDGGEVDGDGEDGGEGVEMEGEEVEDRRVLNAALAAVCNIVMEFSPLRPIYLRKGLMPRLVQILNRSSDSSLRLNALWAVKNSLNRTTSETKRDMMSDLGWNRLFELLHDPDLTIQEQAYGIIRNLSSDEDGMEMVFQEMGQDAVLDSITEAISLEHPAYPTTPVSPTSSSTSPATPPHLPAPSLADRTPTLIQALWALANLCSGPSTLTSSVLQKPQLLLNLRTCLAECGSEVRKPAVQCVLVLAQEHPRRRRALVDAGVVGTLRRLCEWGPTVVGAASSSSTYGGAGYPGVIGRTPSGGAATSHGAVVPIPGTGTTVADLYAQAHAQHQAHTHPQRPSYANYRAQSATATTTAGSGSSSIAGAGAGVSASVPTTASIPPYSAYMPPGSMSTSAVSASIDGNPGTYAAYAAQQAQQAQQQAQQAQQQAQQMQALAAMGYGAYVSPYASGPQFAYPSPHPSYYQTTGPGLYHAYPSGPGVHTAHYPHPIHPPTHAHHAHSGVIGGAVSGGATAGAGVGASMDMDKEVYERARMALDWLEHGDGSGS
ncbi:hypothetical protein DFP72DRAFT_1042425 [Ephemerocybe angulata]|uniref:Armadillo repeat-containing protein 8 n=1 Tax=Ephemerocybe angulata TaxID=980116 RepID=A0A8H6I8P8_9AGAR|nr:hypothetical protein DFP72DRAFT_1042425 [Tulosesus angulatus]